MKARSARRTIPAARLLAAQKAINATWNADDADQRTIPIGANRSISVATNSDGANNNILIAAQDTNGSGDFQIIVEHVEPGAGMGGGTADGVVTGGSVSGTTLTLERSVGADITITGLPSGGGAAFDISALPELSSGASAGHDQFAVYDVSDSTQKHLTLGSLAAKLAGTGLSSDDGVLSVTGGGGGIDGMVIRDSASAFAMVDVTALVFDNDDFQLSGTGAVANIASRRTGIPTSFIGQSWNADDTRLTLGLNRSGLTAITRDIDIPNRYRIPSGGDAGQALTKSSGADYDYEWSTVMRGGGTTPRTDEDIRDVSYAGMRGGPGIRVDVQDARDEVFISVENNAFAQFAIAAFEAERRSVVHRHDQPQITHSCITAPA